MEKRQSSLTNDREDGSTPSFEHIVKNLKAQKKSLLSEVGIMTGVEKSQKGESFPDFGDQASAEENQNFVLRLRERERKLLKKIDEALARISNGTFGICDSCEEEISPQRLEARPVTTYCIDCKTQQEEEEKTRR